MQKLQFLALMALLLIGAQVPQERIINRFGKPVTGGVDLYRELSDVKPAVHLQARRPVFVYSVVDSTWYRLRIDGEPFYAHRDRIALNAANPAAAAASGRPGSAPTRPRK